MMKKVQIQSFKCEIGSGIISSFRAQTLEHEMFHRSFCAVSVGGTRNRAILNSMRIQGKVNEFQSTAYGHHTAKKSII